MKRDLVTVKNFIFITMGVVVISGVVIVLKEYISTQQVTKPVAQELKTVAAQTQVVATELEVPWELEFLPDGSLLVTERIGKLTRIFPEEKTSLEVTGVVQTGESGLQGLAIDPNFATNNWIYIYVTTQGGDRLVNQVERYTLDLASNTLSQRTVIVSDIPAAEFHDGGRIRFGPDGWLYISTGDATQETLAQDPMSLAGKILRVHEHGEIEMVSLGHRNVQGLAWDAAGRLWATEHGPSGLQTGNDEVNLIVLEQNYGWPIIKGSQEQAGLISPVLDSGRGDTWAPTAADVVGNTLLFSGLRGEAVYAADIVGSDLVNLRAYFKHQYGRIRVVKVGPDGWLYIGTSNRDGRGRPSKKDDQIIKIPLKELLDS